MVDKKYMTKIASQNISLLIVVLFTTYLFINQLVNALSMLARHGTLDYFEFSFIMLKLGITNGGFHGNYTIYYYPLFPIAVELIYNIIIVIKNNMRISDKS